MTSSLVRLPARELSRAIHARDASCVDVMRAFLTQIESLNPKVNAIVSLQPEGGLLREAEQHDRLLAEGRSKGWMHGFPLAPKDLTDTAGITTTLGSRLKASNVPAADSIVVERMRAAGAILIGKTNTPEFGLGSHTYNRVFGTTGNAWNPQLSAGGSSGGTAVAVALHMLPVADGSDMMGSLRNPAGWNHVLGLRPTPGRVPMWPAQDVFFQQLATEGPMARTAEDLAWLLATQSGHDARAPLSLRDDPAPSFSAPLERDFNGVRAGWLGDLGGYLPIEADVMQTCERALGLIAGTGLQIEPVAPFHDMSRVWTAWCRLRHFTVCGLLREAWDNEADRALLKPEACWEIENGLALRGTDVHAATVERTRWHQDLLAQLRERDFLLLPTAQLAPFPAEWDWPKTVAGRTMDTYHRWMEVVVPGGLAAVPVLAVPAGFDSAGLPVGLQVIGRPGNELSLLQLARAWEQVHPWREQRSPLL